MTKRCKGDREDTRRLVRSALGGERAEREGCIVRRRLADGSKVADDKMKQESARTERKGGV